MARVRISRRDFLRMSAAAAAGITAGPLFADTPSGSRKQPNIIFILCDDLGWGDLSCYGHDRMKTPNLDRLASQGTLFTNYYSCSPVCSPSRTAYVTGHYPARSRIHHALEDPLKPELVQAGMVPFLDPKLALLAPVLKGAGYTTAHIGKWHLSDGGDDPEVKDYGFDYCKVINGKGPTWEEEKKDRYFRARSTGLFVDEALKFIESNRDKPFYLQLWTLVPHATLDPTPEQLSKYWDPKKDNQPYPGATSIFYASVADLDEQLGRLFDKLDELGVAENTLVLFSSDNGPEDIHVRNASHSGAGSTGPFRGRKRSLYEGGVRMPFIVRWPSAVPAGKVNTTSTAAAVDLLPTLCSLAGAKVPAGFLPDGEDITDILRGSGRNRKNPLYWDWRFGEIGDYINYSPQLAVREGEWKFLMNRDGSRKELYNLRTDPMEVDNRVDDKPELARKLAEKLLRWSETLPAGEPSKSAGRNSYPWPK